jgi:hypothetical protein
MDTPERNLVGLTDLEALVAPAPGGTAWEASLPSGERRGSQVLERLGRVAPQRLAEAGLSRRLLGKAGAIA